MKPSEESPRLVIGVAGGTGSGKTTVAEAVTEAAGSASAVILPLDAYYRTQPELPLAVRQKTNYDEPSAFDFDLLVEHLDRLVLGLPVDRPVYDFAAHERAQETVEVNAAPVIVVEGLLVLFEPLLRERMALKVFVDAPPDERFIRRLERDVKERGRSAESVIEQYRRTVKPMHDLFVEPTKQHADLIIPEGGRNTTALAVLTAFVRAYLDSPAELPLASKRDPER